MFFPYDEKKLPKLVIPEIKNSEILCETRLFQLKRNTYVDDLERIFITHPGAVTIIATTPENQIILIRQFRAPAGQWLWEIPAGTLEPDEDPLDCAIRELEEETGFTSKHWKYLFPVFLAPGYSTELIHFFWASRAYPVEKARKGDDDEEIYYLKVTPEKAQNMMAKGAIRDAKTMIALQYWLGGLT
ncbi:MAG TPA: NUDIX hydrolase [Atribacter sp.]|uniref:NUDIX hydrolase n=1 Tax=Atribacter sp. TaxID=2847780 RepID=UPI002C0B4F3D|nr:NUDIX hydrolase [Atribacter sp.]HQK82573.1 NUDIX hydrolase [Atribacter sp.]